MARLNVTDLVRAVDVVDTGIRVAQDPPVQKAATQFKDDLLQAACSGQELAIEASASWLRHRSV